MLSEAQKEDLRRLGFFIRLNEEGPKEGIRRLTEWVESVLDAARSEGLGLDLADVRRCASVTRDTLMHPVGEEERKPNEMTSAWRCLGCIGRANFHHQVVHDPACSYLAAERVLAALEGRKEESRELRRIDPKFHIGQGGAIVKTSSDEVIPEDEPLLLLRARDHLALPLLWHYRELSRLDGCNDYHLAGVDDRIAAFERFKAEHPELMKQPGVTRGAPFVPDPAPHWRCACGWGGDAPEKGIAGDIWCPDCQVGDGLVGPADSPEEPR